MYSTVQSAVLIGDEKTEWFELYTGVRQGCVMSPILFSLFVNGLAREIKAVGKGVQVGRQRVQLLLYADDIVLISDTQNSRKWRFRVNPKKGKSEVMRFGINVHHPNSPNTASFVIFGLHFRIILAISLCILSASSHTHSSSHCCTVLQCWSHQRLPLEHNPLRTFLNFLIHPPTQSSYVV